MEILSYFYPIFFLTGLKLLNYFFSDICSSRNENKILFVSFFFFFFFKNECIILFYFFFYIFIFFYLFIFFYFFYFFFCFQSGLFSSRDKDNKLFSVRLYFLLGMMISSYFLSDLFLPGTKV